MTEPMTAEELVTAQAYLDGHAQSREGKKNVRRTIRTLIAAARASPPPAGSDASAKHNAACETSNGNGDTQASDPAGREEITRLHSIIAQLVYVDLANGRIETAFIDGVDLGDLVPGLRAALQRGTEGVGDV